MSDAWAEYVSDPRRVCKYGFKCYQKNENHLKQFKHPPEDIRKGIQPPNAKKIKLTIKDDMPPKTSALTKTIEESNVSTDTENAVEPRDRNVSCDSDVQEKVEIDISCTSSKCLKMHDIPENPESYIESLFLFKMHKDFFSFWDFCKMLGNDDPENSFKDVGLYLVGPYDVMTGKLPVLQDEDTYLLNWRYYYDPPEFQTVLASRDKNGYHMGYYRDSPDEMPIFVASGYLDSCKIEPIAGNIFGALYNYLQNMKKKSPFKSVVCQKLQLKLKSWASKNEFSLDAVSPEMKKRNLKIASKTFHGAGIVVPVERKTELGYRPLIETDDKIKEKLTLLANADSDAKRDKAMSSLQEVITMANIATDECDFGTGLELGLDLFSFGHPTLHRSAETLLKTAYSMLNKHTFEKIITVHLANRRKGIDMSLRNL